MASNSFNSQFSNTGDKMSETSTLIGYAGRTINREDLALVPTPPATATHQPVPHHEIVQALVETLGFRHIGVVHDEYAVSPDGMKMFGVLDLETEMHGARFSIGLRNSHDKTMRLALTCGYRLWGAHHKRYYAEQRIMRSTAPPMISMAFPSQISFA